MKLIKNSIYALSMLSVMGLWSCSNDEMLPGGTDLQGHPVTLTLTVNRGDTQTRTQISENDQAGLTSVWEKDKDVLHVYDAKGKDVGTLKIDEIVSPSVAVFSGTVEVADGESTYNIWYYPEENDNLIKISEGLTGYTTLVVNLNNQNFTSAADFAKLEILSKEIKLNVQGKNATVTKDEEMKSRMSFARFSLAGVDGKKGTLEVYNAVVKATDGTIASYTDMWHTVTFDTRNPGVRPGLATDANKNIVLNNIEGGKDVFMALAPESDYTLAFIFTATDGSKYTYNYTKATQIVGGKYYNEGLDQDGKVQGATITLTKESGTSAVNPGDVGSWAHQNLDPEAHNVEIGLVSTADGWTLNDSNYGAEHYGGFSYYVEYDHNGIYNGLLTSKNNSRFDTSAIFYQWGRWLGFPYCANYIYTVPTGNYEIYTDAIYTEMLPLGVNYYETKIGYSWANSLSGAYVSTYMGGNDSWTKQRAINCSICYGLGASQSGHLDYVYTNEDCSWETRGLNPAPDGYAIPTVEQISALIPNGNEVASNTVQYKTIDGVRYAMLWKKVNKNVGGSSTLPAVEIKSFATQETNVKSTDSRFSSITPVTLITFGCLDNEGDLQNEGTHGYYWTCESGKNVMSGTSGNGGVVLVVSFNGTKIKMQTTVIPRTFAANVLLISDPSKKTDTIKPWFPMTGVGTVHW